MPICSECKLDWPEANIQHGVCDQCFKYGREKSIEMSKGQPSAPLSGVSNQSPSDSFDNIILTTSIDVPQREIHRVVSIVSSEAAIGLNVIRDIANNWRDFFGGRAKSSENALISARQECLIELRRQASQIGADAVIAINIQYNEISTSGTGGILFVAANGTAVKLEPN